jgi:hypothetical protein
LLFVSLAQTAAPAPQGEKQLTIEEMFKPGGILGRGPENVQWSPDGAKVSFVQRDDSGDHGELYYVDVATGKSAVLVASGKLASLAPPASAIKDERKKEAATALLHRRLSMGARLQTSALRLHGPALALQPGQRHRRATYLQQR